MIFITQLIYIKEGQEAIFHDFESKVIPLMSEHGGKIIQRIRPDSSSFIEGENKKPYEVHIICFESEEGLVRYTKDDRRQALIKLKEQSIESVIMFKGNKI